MALSTIDRSAHRNPRPSAVASRQPDPGVVFDRLAGHIAELADRDPMTGVVWSAIIRIEELLGIPLGEPDDSLALLWRRFARVHRAVGARPSDDRRRADAARIAMVLLQAMR